MRIGNRFSMLVLREPLLFVMVSALGIWMLIVLPIYLYTDHREKQLASNGVTTSGTVVSAERACSDDECQLVTVTYKVEGKDYRLEANTDPNDPRADAGLSVGQKVEVRYDPANRERARLMTLGQSDAGFLRFMLIFGLIFLGLPTVYFLIKRLFTPPDPLPEVSAGRAHSGRDNVPAARHDAHRLPDGGVVLVPSYLPPLALLSGLVALPGALFAVDLAGRVGFAVLWPLFLAFVTFGSSRSLVAGPGWLATKRGLRWQGVHDEDLLDAPPANALDAYFGQSRALRLYSSDTRIDINGRQLGSPEVRAAVESFVEQAPNISPATRIHLFGLMRATESDAPFDPKTLLRRIWMLAALLSALYLIATIMVLVFRG